MSGAKRVSPGGVQAATPADYVVTCISTYPADLIAADAAVARLKAGGLRHMTRSRLIRIALAKLDVDAVLAEETEREAGRIR
jgi:hypothetical protein